MQPTDLGDRVAAQRELRGASWFSDLLPTLGRDPESGLELEVDVTGWPTRVTRLDAVVDALRDEAGLLRAVRRAVGGLDQPIDVRNITASQHDDQQTIPNSLA